MISIQVQERRPRITISRHEHESLARMMEMAAVQAKLRN